MAGVAQDSMYHVKRNYHHIDAETGIAKIVFTGYVSGVHLCGAIRRVAEHPAWRPGFCRLWDWRRIRVLDITPEDIAEAVRTISGHGCQASASAFIVTREEHVDIVRLFDLKTKGWPVKAFWEEKSAVAWLREQQAAALAKVDQNAEQSNGVRSYGTRSTEPGRVNGTRSGQRNQVST